MLNAKTAVIEDVFADPRIPHDAYRPTFVKSLIMTPVGEENPVAAIGAYWQAKRSFTDEEVARVKTMSLLIGDFVFPNGLAFTPDEKTLYVIDTQRHHIRAFDVTHEGFLARGSDPVETRRVLPGEEHDSHSRYIEAAANGVLVACLYLPNGNPAPGPKFDYKLRWFDHLNQHAAQLFGLDAPVVLAGDYNVMPTELDVYAPERWLGDALFRPEVRAAYAALLEQGWCDALREMHPDERIYTFWDYWRNAFGRNAGLRIDHLLLNAAAARLLKAAEVDREIRARDKPSDHAPVWVELDL